jgi:hypothetical protein
MRRSIDKAAIHGLGHSESVTNLPWAEGGYGRPGIHQVKRCTCIVDAAGQTLG